MEVRRNQCKGLPVSKDYSHIHPKNLLIPFQLLLLTKTLCIYIYISSLQSCSRRTKELQENSREPHGQTCFFNTDITFENFLENHVRKQIKPTRDHHELFFCVKSPTDNSCIESEARRNNKNLCISKSLIFTQYLYTELSNLFNNISFRKMSVWM